MNIINLYNKKAEKLDETIDCLAIEVDGQPLYKRIDSGSTNLDYCYIDTPRDVEAYFMGDVFPDWTIHGEKLILLDCSCGVSGCRPIGCTIEVKERSIVWTDFIDLQSEHYLEGAPKYFEFDSEQYSNALKEFRISNKRL